MTADRPQTIQIFLPDGNPTSIKIADLTNRMIVATFIPRKKLSEVSNRQEVKKYGIYFLFGINEDKAKPISYIGETDNCFTRLTAHHREKDFWTHAVVISHKANFTKAHVEYLEYLGIKTAREVARFDTTDNKATPTKPFITESMEADLLDNFETIKILLSTLGYPIFDEIISSTKKKETLFCKGKEASATGEMLDDGFVVFKGSKSNKDETRTATPWVLGLRKKLIDDKIMISDKDVYVFSEDFVFSSPSAAAATVLGRQANGWTEWKNKEGVTIDKLYRLEIPETNSK